MTSAEARQLTAGLDAVITAEVDLAPPLPARAVEVLQATNLCPCGSGRDDGRHLVTGADRQAASRGRVDKQ